MKKIIIGSDHGGYKLKEHLKKELVSFGYEYVDFGCKKEESTDYPDIAFLVAESVATNENYVGIVIDGMGVGSAMTANKVPGVRCAVCWDITSIINSKSHNNANMLSIGGQSIGFGLAWEMTEKWLNTEFSGGRHDRRVTKIMEIESRFLKRK